MKLMILLTLLIQSTLADKLPSEILDLKLWKLTMPFSEKGKESPKEIKFPEILRYEHKNSFFVNSEGTGVIFRAHCTFTSTKNSKYPRCELREMTQDNKKASWRTDKGSHIMESELAISALPPVKKHVVCAQIHDSKDDVMMVRLEGKKLFIERNKVGDIILDDNYTLGEKFKLKIQAADKRIKVWYNGVQKMNWQIAANGCYFKAGCYTQSNPSKGDSPESYGEVIIYNLKVQHSK